MNCNRCSCLRWHPNKGFYCTVPDCKPDTREKDVREIYQRAFGTLENPELLKVVQNEINRCR